MKRTTYFGLLACLALISGVTPTNAVGIDDRSRSAARKLVKDGVTDFDAGQFELALKKFMEALDVANVPTVAVWAAQANEKLGRLVAASELYETALLMPRNELWVGRNQEQAQQQARAALKELKSRIPAVKLETTDGVEGTEVQVTIDNVKLPNALLHTERSLDPGEHVIVAEQGTKSATETVTLAQGDRATVRLRLAEASAAVPATGVNLAAAQPVNQSMSPGTNAPSTADGPAPSNASTVSTQRRSATKEQRALGWIGVGIGAAGVVLGATTGTLVGLKRSSLHSDGCVGNDCIGPSYKGRVDSYNALRTVSTIGFLVGGVAATAGVTLLLTSHKEGSAPKVSLMLSPGQLNLTGTY